MLRTKIRVVISTEHAESVYFHLGTTYTLESPSPTNPLFDVFYLEHTDIAVTELRKGGIDELLRILVY
eukprot:5157516-Pleurochrysis_carterae.AAC.3